MTHSRLCKLRSRARARRRPGAESARRRTSAVAAAPLALASIACTSPPWETEVVGATATAAPAAGLRIVPSSDPLPAVAFQLHVSIPLSKEAGCDGKTARLELAEISSAWGPLRDPESSPGLHELRAVFVGSGEGCCPPYVYVFTDAGERIASLTPASFDVPQGVLCHFAGAASASAGFRSPVGTRALRVEASPDERTALVIRIDLETGKAELTKAKRSP